MQHLTVYKNKNMLNKKIIQLIVLAITLFCYSCNTPKNINLEKSTTFQDSNRLSFYNGDTIKYINYLYNHQAKYIGLPLSILLSELDIKVYRFRPNVPQKRDGKTYGIVLEFSENDISAPIIDNYGNRQNLELGIGWQTFVLRDSITGILKADESLNYKWSEKAEEYFGKQIVGNFWLMNYMKQ